MATNQILTNNFSIQYAGQQLVNTLGRQIHNTLTTCQLPVGDDVNDKYCNSGIRITTLS